MELKWKQISINTVNTMQISWGALAPGKFLASLGFDPNIPKHRRDQWLVWRCSGGAAYPEAIWNTHAEALLLPYWMAQMVMNQTQKKIRNNTWILADLLMHSNTSLHRFIKVAAQMAVGIEHFGTSQVARIDVFSDIQAAISFCARSCEPAQL